MKNTIIRRLALVSPIFLGFAITAKASVINLVINEVSSTTLTYSWQGGTLQTVTDISPDYWQFTINDGVVSPVTPGDPYNIYVQWEEPNYATSHEVNKVNFYQYGPASNGSTITVWSDIAYNDGYPLENNNVIYTFPNPPAPSGNSVQFNDNGDDPGVPDGGVTALLLGLGFGSLALFGIRQNRPQVRLQVAK